MESENGSASKQSILVEFKEFIEDTQVLISTFSLEQNDLIQIRLAAKERLKRAT
jgi:hypothetical protein